MGTTIRVPAVAEATVDEVTEQRRKKVPGWESKGDDDETSRASSFDRKSASYSGDNSATTREEGCKPPVPLPPVSVNGERSYLEATLDAGLSPSAAIAAGWEPTASARGLQASVVAKAVTVSFVGATVVLGPVIGRVTQGSAIILVEVGSKAPVACVLMDGVSGGQHRQVGMDMMNLRIYFAGFLPRKFCDRNVMPPFGKNNAPSTPELPSACTRYAKKSGSLNSGPTPIA